MSLILDSVTVFPPDAHGRAAIAASHGGTYAAYLAAKVGIKAVILCDAGVGRDRAGIGGLHYLNALGCAAATIGHRSARIGDGKDCAERGVITYVNATAATAGIARLPVLEKRGIAGACVSAWSARIGDGQSTYRDGYVSAINARAAICGAEIGISAKELVARLVAARVKELK